MGFSLRRLHRDVTMRELTPSSDPILTRYSSGASTLAQLASIRDKTGPHHLRPMILNMTTSVPIGLKLATSVLRCFAVVV